MSELRMTQFVFRGVAAGVVAGSVAALISLLVVEKPLAAALEIEEARAPAIAGRGGDPFSRLTQIVGGMLAVIVVAVLIGVVFAVVYRAVGARIVRHSAFGRSLYLGAIGFGAVVLMPMIKYPSNPPGVGDPGTVDQRTTMYLALIAACLVVAVLAHWAYLALEGRGWSAPVRGLAVAVAAVLAVGAVGVFWPANPDPIPSDVPAALLWQWRLSSLLELAALWAVLGIAFGLLVDPAARRRSRQPRTEAALA